MESFKLNKSRQLLVIALGFVFSASTLAAVTSAPTSTVKGRAPIMAAPTIDYTDADANGVVSVGDTLTINDGAITDADGDIAIASTYVWKVGGANVGTASTYVITAADAGQPITAEATPRTDPAVTDPDVGLAVAAQGGTADGDGDGSIPVANGEDVQSVAISGYVNGNPEVGTALTAIPTCVSTCGTVTYQWQRETAVGSGSFADISGATSSTYTPVGGDQRLKIQVVASN